MTSTRATLMQVAERAGASLASTSRALHGTGASDAMIERVRTAAAELGYSVDAIGRSLRMKKTFQVAFAVADIGNPVYVEMMRGIHEVLAPHGYRVVIMTTGDAATSAAELVRSLNSGFSAASTRPSEPRASPPSTSRPRSPMIPPSPQASPPRVGSSPARPDRQSNSMLSWRRTICSPSGASAPHVSSGCRCRGTWP
jgi:hypothetical protein